jgi:hypothetical protein
MYTFLATIVGMLALSPVLAHEPESGIPADNAAACMQGPLAQFGQYLGNWDIQDFELGKDGKEWTEGAGAKWNFICVGDGTAVQDFWMPTDGSVGTNLRTYNTETESWDIVWTIKPKPGFTHIQARQDEHSNIVMHVMTPVPDPLRRITFFPADADGWNWKLEFSSDDGDSWFEVYRIKATPSTR